MGGGGRIQLLVRIHSPELIISPNSSMLFFDFLATFQIKNNEKVTLKCDSEDELQTLLAQVKFTAGGIKD